MVWLTNWNYRKPITINNDLGSALTDYLMPITVTYASAMQADFDDIRFIYPNGDNIPYWIETKVDSDTALVWIKVNLPNFGVSPTGDNTIYMYYGNSLAISAADFSGTMKDYVDYTTGTLYDHGNADWIPNNGDVIDGTHYNINNFTINPGYTIYVNAYNGTNYGKLIISAANMDISGTLNATGKGYRGATVCSSNGEGPGAGMIGARGGGAGYGGYGGGGGSMPRGATYGNYIAPNYMGSGGATSPVYCRGYAGSGGGQITLRASKILTNNGIITSNGTNSQSGVGGSNGGGGSGGTVYINAGTITGSGSITANGGSDPDGCCGGGGGGGRIAVYYRTTNYSGTMAANGGTGWETGGIGTIYTYEYLLAIMGQEETNMAWLTNWNYRKIVTISNTGSTLVDYQTLITVDTATLISTGKMQPDGRDIRFTLSDSSTYLNYWIESGINTSSTKIWIKSTLVNGDNTIYMYYGNPAATSVASATNTFVRVIGGDAEQVLIGAWNFADNALDLSGNGNNGTLYGTTSYATGKFNRAISFGGAGSYVNAGPGANVGSSFSISAWVKPTGDASIIIKGTDPTHYPYYGLGISGGKIVGYAGSGSGVNYDITGTAPVSANNWHHLVITYTGGNGKTYVDGVYNTTDAAAGAGTTTLPLYFGCWRPGYGHSIFLLENARVYNRVLTQTEITDLVNNYGYITLSYPGRELIRKYATIEPTTLLGPEEIPPDLIIDGTTTTLYGVQTYNNLQIINGGILYVNAYDGTTPDTGTLEIHANSILVDATSQIIADALGFRGMQGTVGPAEGPGAGTGGSYSGSGGGYGGAGGGTMNTPGPTYGTLSGIDIESGSGGGCGIYFGSYGKGGNGGGSVALYANTITINGIVSSNGENGIVGAGQHGSGGGSGGGILLNGTTVTISGTVRANGGNGSNASGSPRYGGDGGGGGRIKIFYSTLDIAGSTITANGSLGGLGNGSPSGQAGANGTIYPTLPANITATSMTVTPSETPCRVGICTVTVDVTWTNNGGSSGDFIPNITIDGNSYSNPYPLQSLGAGASVTKTFIISGLALGVRAICPYPN